MDMGRRRDDLNWRTRSAFAGCSDFAAMRFVFAGRDDVTTMRPTFGRSDDVMTIRSTLAGRDFAASRSAFAGFADLAAMRSAFETCFAATRFAVARASRFVRWRAATRAVGSGPLALASNARTGVGAALARD